MNRLQKAALLTALAERLRANGSWCGETHVQKATYFLQALLGLPTGYEFILYKHGPYSFDLSEELTALRADYLLTMDYRSPGYGPGLVPTPTSAELRARYPVTLARYRRAIEFVARAFGVKGVTELEKLATALYVTREIGGTADPALRANRLHALKPHVSPADALAAVQELDRLAAEAKTLATEPTHV
jgi:hypothetical protein